MLPLAARPLVGSLTVAAGVFILLLATSPMLPMAWDEGNAIERAAGIADWMAALAKRGTDALAAEEIARHWHYTVEIEGHPTLYGIIIAAGRWLGGGWLSPLSAARLGPMLLFALAAAALFHRLRRDYSLTAALGGLAALVTMPRLFAHAHFASFDGPLTSFWLLTWAAFSPTAGSTKAIVWGMTLGATMSCKFTGWLAPLPFLAYAAVYGDGKLARAVAIGLLAALGTFWLLNPRLWHQPIAGLITFFNLNLGRAGTALDIPTLFFGARYTQLSGLPWYNTLVWTGITVPVGTLLFAIAGMAGAVRRWAAESQGALLLLNWLTLVAVRALPGAPVHDAERLILPSFAFLAALAGVGCHFVMQRHPRCSARLGIALVFLGSASSLVWYSPQWLSYYNLLIGGLRGADRAGMEAAYYWDALDKEVLAWLHEHTAPGERIEFASGSPANLQFMRRWGLLRRGWRPDEPGRYRWRVIQRRPPFYSDRDRRLVEHAAPAWVKTIRPPNSGFGPWRLDVPLIEVFACEAQRNPTHSP